MLHIWLTFVWLYAAVPKVFTENNIFLILGVIISYQFHHLVGIMEGEESYKESLISHCEIILKKKTPDQDASV